MRRRSIASAAAPAAPCPRGLRGRREVPFAALGGLAAVLACGALAGCSSSSAGAAADGGPASSGDSGGGGSDDGGPGGGGSSDGGADSGGTVTAGEVAFFSGGSGPQSGAYTIVGGFLRGSGHAGGGTGSAICETPVGSCRYCNSISSADAGPSGGGVTITLLNAGVVTAKDGATALGTLAYNADDAGMGDYELDSNADPTLTWAAGDTLIASATGGQFPAFSASITAPQAITGVTPALSLASAAAVSTSAPFVLSWTPSSDTGAQMGLVIGGYSGSGTASCTAADSAGSITVPPAILQKFGTGGGTMGLTKTVSKPLAITGVTAMIQASAPAVDGSVTFGP